MKILSRNKTPRLATLLRPLAVGVMSSTASIGVSAAGLIDDTTGALNLRNFYQKPKLCRPVLSSGKGRRMDSKVSF